MSSNVHEWKLERCKTMVHCMMLNQLVIRNKVAPDNSLAVTPPQGDTAPITKN